MTFSPQSSSRAELHEAMARNYRGRAQVLLDRDSDLDSAGALLYESAKQCINAVANQRGENPGPARAKLRFLRDLVEQRSIATDMLRNWQNAVQLHIHADRSSLIPSAFMEHWSATQAFIDQMLLIYRAPE